MTRFHPIRKAFIPAKSIWEGERNELEASVSVANAFNNLRQRLVFLVLWVMTIIASTGIYARVLNPDYIATTQILLQPRIIVSDGPESLRQFYQLVIDNDQCETELQLLGSQRLLYQVYKVQNLVDASETRGGADGLWSFIGNILDRIQRLSAVDSASMEAFNAFIGRVRARRLGLSYVIELSYRAHSAEQATKIVNAIASNYAAYRLRGVLSREQRRGVYLESRLSNLVRQIEAAEEGARLGVIPEGALFDSDVRLLGPASRPLGVAYPKVNQLMMMMATLALISGLLIILLPHRISTRYGSRNMDNVLVSQIYAQNGD